MTAGCGIFYLCLSSLLFHIISFYGTLYSSLLRIALIAQVVKWCFEVTLMEPQVSCVLCAFLHWKCLVHSATISCVSARHVYVWPYNSFTFLRSDSHIKLRKVSLTALFNIREIEEDS